MWQPSWRPTEVEEFRAKLRSAMAQEGAGERGWVVEGDYMMRGGDIAHEASTDVICECLVSYAKPCCYPLVLTTNHPGLDPPLLLYFPRLILRTFRRLFGWEAPCAVGCSESVKEAFFSKDSIIWWCLSQHWINRRRNQARMEEIGLGIGRNIARQRMRRFGGWGKDLGLWLIDVRAVVQKKQD